MPTDGFKQDFVAASQRYQVRVAHSPWGQWRTRDEDFPEAEFGAMRAGCCLAVVPVPLEGERPEWEAFTAGMLRLMDIEYPSDQVNSSALNLPGTIEGGQLSCVRRVKGRDYLYHLQVLRDQDTGYLLAAWGPQELPNVENVLTDGLLSAVEPQIVCERLRK